MCAVSRTSVKTKTVAKPTQGYSLVCNKFDAVAPPMANVLWLFYISKVLDFMDTFFIAPLRSAKHSLL